MISELYVRFGTPDDPVPGTLKNSANAKDVNYIDMYDTLKFGVGDFIKEIEALNASPSESAVDLMVLASAVYFADTSFNRVVYSDDGWTRQFCIHVPVSQPDVWISAKEHLNKMLRFLTGDFWDLRFRARPEKYRNFSVEPEELDLNDVDTVSLFSGGLDSLIGAIDLIDSGKKPLLISHYWDGEAASAQRVLLESFQTKYGKDAFVSVRGYIGARSNSLQGAGSENTQRARSFLFYSMAALAADAMTTTDTVMIPENGLIALNVPMDRVRLGSLSTRTAHPHFINAMSTLADSTGISANFTNPFRFKTKGEMASECADKKFLKEVTPKSMSCSSPAKIRYKSAAPQHCGYCVPCMIRRASLAAGLDGDDPTQYYEEDLTDHVFDSRKAAGKDIRSFMYASKKLANAPNIARFLVRKPGPLPAADIEKYADVYRRGMAEVALILKGVRSYHE